MAYLRIYKVVEYINGVCNFIETTCAYVTEFGILTKNTEEPKCILLSELYLYSSKCTCPVMQGVGRVAKYAHMHA